MTYQKASKSIKGVHMYRLLIIEDDKGIAEAIKTQAEMWGMQAHMITNFRNVMAQFAEVEPHIVLLDIALPFFNGYHWCSEIRKVSKVPIIFISSASDNMNMIMAMNMGADDFVAKPFDLNVLSAKINAVLRRAYNFSAPKPKLTHRGAELDNDSACLIFEGNKIELTKNEFRILQLLFERRGRTVPREDIMQALWESDSFIDDNTLTVNVARLRAHLAEIGLEGLIRTQKGLGYLVDET